MKARLLLPLILSCSLSCSSSDKPAPTIPKVSIEDKYQMEGNDGMVTLNYTVRLDKSTDQDVILKYETEDASAFQGLDYKKTSGELTILAGQTEANFPIEIISDQIKEGNEMFRVLFSTDMNLNFNSQTAQIIINNDDTSLPYGTEDYETPEEYQGWTLAWADEFNGSAINTDWWSHEIGNGDSGWGNNELEFYTDATENSRIENGKLVIEARNDSWDGHQYTSARMVTKGKKHFTFCRVDIRARLPYGQGIWPALWMLGENIGEKGWPACGEIDIMELIGNHPDEIHATVHWANDVNNHKYFGKGYSLSNETFNDRFHVFTVVREFNQMFFYVDDILTFQFSSKDLQGHPNPFNESFFFIFNVAIGGNWPGNPDETTAFPQKMEVDYIRVFEKED